jgi:hypothetical protein
VESGGGAVEEVDEAIWVPVGTEYVAVEWGFSEMLGGPEREIRTRKRGRQSPQGRTLPPTFEKPREERAYEWEVSRDDRMCQTICVWSAEFG